MNMTTAGNTTPVTQTGGMPEDAHTELVEAFLTASRVLIAVAVRSLDAGDTDITLPQHRTLVLLATRGPQRMIDLADLLGVNSSTATRHCDRLQRRGLIRREPAKDDRRAVQVSLTTTGRHIVDRVSDTRRDQISHILHTMPAHARQGLLVALNEFAHAAGEVPDQNWTLGWGTDVPR